MNSFLPRVRGAGMFRWAAGAAAGIVVAMCAACTAPGGHSAQDATGVGLPTGNASYLAVDTDSRDAAHSPPPSDATSVAIPSATAASIAPTSTALPAGPAVPGGTGDIATLVAAGDLAPDGKIDLYGQGVPADGAESDPIATATLCGYLFGTTSAVAEIGRLDGDVTLDPISGRHTASALVESSGGPAAGTTAAHITAPGTTAQESAASVPILIACVYRSDGVPVLALQVGDGPPVDPDLPGSPIIVDSAGLHAVLSYSPNHHGATIAPTIARAWLDAVIDRVAPTQS